MFCQIKHPLYNQTYFLNTYHKRNIKEELGKQEYMCALYVMSFLYPFKSLNCAFDLSFF